MSDDQEEQLSDVDDEGVVDGNQGERLPHDGAIPLTDQEKKLGVRRRRPSDSKSPPSLNKWLESQQRNAQDRV